MKRKHKTYSRPKRPFEKERIQEEEKIKEEFGLKNKREIWKADAKVKKIREKAKKLISAPLDEQKRLFEQLKKIGLNVHSISDVLSLRKEDYLKRRLQTVLVEKKFASTSKMARQLIIHKKVLVDGSIVSAPSYIVPIKLEDKITLKEPSLKKNPREEKSPFLERKSSGKEEKTEEKEEEEK